MICFKSCFAFGGFFLNIAVWNNKTRSGLKTPRCFRQKANACVLLGAGAKKELAGLERAIL